MKKLDGRYSVNAPFLFHTLEEKGENSILTMYAKEPVSVGDELIFNGFKQTHPHSIVFTVAEIVENRDHRGFVSVTNVTYSKNEKGEKITDYTYKSEPEKKKNSFYKVRGSFSAYNN